MAKRKSEEDQAASPTPPGARPKDSSKLLIEEPPLQVLPSLAVAIGLTEAIIVQQMHYWLLRSRHTHDGRKWIYNTYEDWHEQFPFWSVPTIKRAILGMQRERLIFSRNFNKLSIDRTKWYTLNYDHIALLRAPSVGRRGVETEELTPWDQSDPMGGSPVSPPSDQIDPMDGSAVSVQRIGMDPSVPETTAETTPETTTGNNNNNTGAVVVASSGNEKEGDDEEWAAGLVAELEELGITPAEASRLAVDPDLADRWLAWLDSLPVAERPAKPAGFIVAKLRSGEQPPPPRPRFQFPRRA